MLFINTFVYEIKSVGQTIKIPSSIQAQVLLLIVDKKPLESIQDVYRFLCDSLKFWNCVLNLKLLDNSDTRIQELS